MAKRVEKTLKVVAPEGKATPAPPLGSALGSGGAGGCGFGDVEGGAGGRSGGAESNGAIGGISSISRGGGGTSRGGGSE